MDNRDDQKIPPAGSYMHSPGVPVNQPPSMKTASSPAAPYPVQYGETDPLHPPTYTTVVGPQQNQNIPPNKGFHWNFSQYMWPCQDQKILKNENHHSLKKCLIKTQYKVTKW